MPLFTAERTSLPVDDCAGEGQFPHVCRRSDLRVLLRVRSARDANLRFELDQIECAKDCRGDHHRQNGLAVFRPESADTSPGQARPIGAAGHGSWTRDGEGRQVWGWRGQSAQIYLSAPCLLSVRRHGTKLSEFPSAATGLYGGTTRSIAMDKRIFVTLWLFATLIKSRFLPGSAAPRAGFSALSELQA
jgi:hypothetical protein